MGERERRERGEREMREREERGAGEKIERERGTYSSSSHGSASDHHREIYIIYHLSWSVTSEPLLEFARSAELITQHNIV